MNFTNINLEKRSTEMQTMFSHKTNEQSKDNNEIRMDAIYWKTWFEMDFSSTDDSSDEEMSPYLQRKRKSANKEIRQSKFRKIHNNPDISPSLKNKMSLTKIKEKWLNSSDEDTSDWSEDSFEFSFSSSSSLLSESLSSSSSSILSISSGYCEGTVSDWQGGQSDGFNGDSSDSESLSTTKDKRVACSDRQKFDSKDIVIGNTYDGIFHQKQCNFQAKVYYPCKIGGFGSNKSYKIPKEMKTKDSIDNEIISSPLKDENRDICLREKNSRPTKIDKISNELQSLKEKNSSFQTRNIVSNQNPHTCKGIEERSQTEINSNLNLKQTSEIYQVSKGFGFNRWYHSKKMVR